MSQSPPSSSSASSTHAASAAGWAGLDPTQLEPGGRRKATFVVGFVVYLAIAGLILGLIVLPQTDAKDDGASNEAAELRGAPIDPGAGGQSRDDDATSGDDEANERNRYEPQSKIAEAFANRLDDRWAPVGFEILTSYEVPDPWGPMGALDAKLERRAEIPDYIHELDNESVAVVGFASTHHLASEGRAREFVLFRTREQCCFGVLPLPHEVILCYVEDEKGLDLQDGVPMRIKGVLEIAPEYDGDHLLGVYRMEARDAVLVDK